MNTSSFWFQGEPFDPLDPGSPIGQSLRFRGAQLLETPYFGSANTFGSNWTISFWVKFAGPINTTRQIIATGLRSPGSNYTILSLNDSTQGKLETYSGSTNFNFNGRLFRDPSAWYHIVMSNDEVYVNGEAQGATANYWSYLDGCDKFGFSNWTSAPSSRATMYLADAYLVQQTLTASTFGRYNANGVWVPVSPSGLTYGTNGFHLTFADPSDVGKDYSGNGNDFTATGFDTNSLVSGYWVDAVYTATSGEVPNSQGTVYITDVQPTDASLDYTNSGTIQKAFDGDLSTSYVYWTGDEYGTGNVMSMTFDLRDYTDIESVELLTSSGAPNTDHSYTLELLDASKVTIAGTQVQTSDAPFASPEWVSAPVSGTPRYFRLWTTPVSGSVYKRLYLYAIRINGQILSQSATTAPTYDLMQDSPTQNFATLNPVLEPSNQTLSDANLTGGGGSTTTSLATQLPDYKYYWEATGSNYYYGLSEIDAVRTRYLGAVSNQVGWFGDGSFWVGGVNLGVFGPSFATTDIGMQAYDPATGNYWVGVNGTWHGSGDPENGTNPAYTVSADLRERMLPASNLTPGTNSFNFGQQPFLYTPPADFSALQTANMPAAPIANGRDHFQALTGPGADILTDAQAAFPNGLWWIKDRVNANEHQLVDVMNGTSDVWHTPAGTGGHTYAAPSGDSVAWCWKAGDSVVANTDGTINSNVRANPDAGFSIVQWTGNATAGSVGHGLNGSPDFVIGTGYTGALIPVWHSAGTPAGGYLYLNSVNRWQTNIDIWNSPNMTATTIGVNTNQIVNPNGQLCTAYVWTAIPGYSAFGSYTGNNSTDGPFIYTGFKPAFVLIRVINAQTNWVVIDSTRNPSNPANLYLHPNLTDNESGNITQQTDMLSNGFKFRSNWNNINYTYTYVYAAFAENPFQSPVTAR